MIENREITGLTEYGIEYQLVPYSEKESYDDQGYIKLPEGALDRIGMLMQYAPAQMANGAIAKCAEETVKGAYKVMLKDGLHLGRSHAKIGAYRGVAFNADNGLAGQANLVPINAGSVAAAPQIALGVFNAASIVTGQYFMAEINSKLSTLETGMSDVLNFLEDDKRSEIIADQITLKEIYQNIRYIMENDRERQSVSEELKQIRKKSLQNTIFYRSRTERTQTVLDPKDKEEEIIRKLNKLLGDFPEYWCSVSNYMLASLLDIVLEEMDAPEYIESIRFTLRQCYTNYQNDFEACNEKIVNLIQEAKVFNKKKIFPEKAGEYLDYLPDNTKPGMVIKIGAELINVFDTFRAQKSEQLKENTRDRQKDFIDACRNYRTFDDMLGILDDYRHLHNDPIEIVYVDDNAYIKQENFKAEEMSE